MAPLYLCILIGDWIGSFLPLSMCLPCFHWLSDTIIIVVTEHSFTGGEAKYLFKAQ